MFAIISYDQIPHVIICLEASVMLKTMLYHQSRTHDGMRISFIKILRWVFSSLQNSAIFMCKKVRPILKLCFLFFSFLFILSNRARNMPTKCVCSTCSTQKTVVLLLKDWDQTTRYVPAHRMWENEIVFYSHTLQHWVFVNLSVESQRSYWMSLLTWIW